MPRRRRRRRERRERQQQPWQICSKCSGAMQASQRHAARAGCGYAIASSQRYRTMHDHVYTYEHVSHVTGRSAIRLHIPLSARKALPRRMLPLGHYNYFRSAKAGGGEHFLPLDCLAEARAKECGFADTQLRDALTTRDLRRGPSQAVQYRYAQSTC